MKQREIYLADLNPLKGSEQRGIRPVVVISGNSMNDHLGISIICPLSTKVKNYAGCLILEKDAINGLEQDSEIITFQIRTLRRKDSSENWARLPKINSGKLKKDWLKY